MEQEQKAVLEEVRFISIRRYANFEGCKFHLFTFRTADPYKIKKLREGRLFGKDYKEVDTEGNDKEPVVKTIVDEIAELEAVLKQKKLDAGITETISSKEKASKTRMPDENDIEDERTLMEGYHNMVNHFSYGDLKDEVKRIIKLSGVKINLNSGKEALRNYLKGK